MGRTFKDSRNARRVFEQTRHRKNQNDFLEMDDQNNKNSKKIKKYRPVVQDEHFEDDLES